MKESTEILIIGAGIAGITTAIELLNHNKKVILIDRDKQENIGGLARISFGGMFFVDTPIQRKGGIKDSPELAFKDWCSVAHFEKNDHWPKEWAKSYVYNCTNDVYHWLTKEHKVKYFPIVHWVERGLLKPGNSYPRFHMVWGTGQELSNKLAHDLINHPKSKTNLTIHYNLRADELIVENGKITGVFGKNEQNNTDFEFKAEATIVATGGLGGNIAKVRENWYKPWGEPPQVILNGSHNFADGLMHDAVEKVNGNVTHLDKNWPYAAGIHHPKPKRENDGLSVVPPKSALWLDYTGKRFGPMPLITAYDTRYIVEQICKQEKKYSWQVMNLKIAYKEFAISGSESNAAMRDKKIFKFLKTILFGNKELVNDMMENCIDFVVANSIEELAEKMNVLQGTNDVDLNHLKESILDYDGQIDRGKKYFNDEQLRRIAHVRQYRGDKVRTSKFQKIFDQKALPLIAIREHILSRKTLGGIQTNLLGQVLSKNNEPINGLYAVGEAAGFGGGGSHGIGALEGTFLGGCVYTAWVTAYALNGKKLN